MKLQRSATAKEHRIQLQLVHEALRCHPAPSAALLHFTFLAHSKGYLRRADVERKACKQDEYIVVVIWCAVPSQSLKTCCSETSEQNCYSCCFFRVSMERIFFHTVAF